MASVYKNSIKSFHNCRICMASVDVQPILEFHDEFENETIDLSHKLRVCCNVDVILEYNLPKHICKLCSDVLTAAYDLIMLCKQTDDILRNSRLQRRDKTNKYIEIVSEDETVSEDGEYISETDLSDESENERESGIIVNNNKEQDGDKMYSNGECDNVTVFQEEELIEQKYLHDPLSIGNDPLSTNHYVKYENGSGGCNTLKREPETLIEESQSNTMSHGKQRKIMQENNQRDEDTCSDISKDRNTNSNIPEDRNTNSNIPEDRNTSSNIPEDRNTNSNIPEDRNTCNNFSDIKIHKERLSNKKNNQLTRHGNKMTNYCLYCKCYVLNFARHLLRNHSSEKDVQELLKHPTKSKERNDALKKIRNQGNFLMSNTVIKPVRASKLGRKTLPCDGCFGFYSENLLWKHRKKCQNNKNKFHKANGQSLLAHTNEIDKQLRDTVFPRMRADNLSMCAKKDFLICAFGAQYMKIHRKKHFINVTSRKMRELARLLLQIQIENPSITSLFNALRPQNFDAIINATKAIAKYDQHMKKYESPTLAMNMGTRLKQCAELAIIIISKKKHIPNIIISAETKADLKTFIQMVEGQWQSEISSQAGNDLYINKTI